MFHMLIAIILFLLPLTQQRRVIDGDDRCDEGESSLATKDDYYNVFTGLFTHFIMTLTFH